MTQTGADNISGHTELNHRIQNTNVALGHVVRVVSDIYRETFNPGRLEHLSLANDSLLPDSKIAKLAVLNEIARRLMNNAGPKLISRVQRLEELSERVDAVIRDATRTEILPVVQDALFDEQDFHEEPLSSPQEPETQVLRRRHGEHGKKNRNARLALLGRIIEDPNSVTRDEFVRIVMETSIKDNEDLGPDLNYVRAVRRIITIKGNNGFVKLIGTRLSNEELSQEDIEFIQKIKNAFERENPGHTIDSNDALRYFRETIFRDWEEMVKDRSIPKFSQEQQAQTIDTLAENLEEIEQILQDEEIRKAIALEFSSIDDLAEAIINGLKQPTIEDVAEQMVNEIMEDHPLMERGEAINEALVLLELVLGLSPAPAIASESSITDGEVAIEPNELFINMDRRTLRDIHTPGPRETRKAKSKDSREKTKANIGVFLQRNNVNVAEYARAAFMGLDRLDDKGKALIQRFLSNTEGITFTLAALNRDGILKYDIKDENNRVVSLSYETYLLLKFLSDLQEIPNFSRKIQRAKINPRDLLIYVHRIIDEVVATERRIIDENQ